MSAKDRIEAYLSEKNVPYAVHEHEFGAFTAEEVAALDEVAASMFAKVVMVVCDGAMTMVVIPADHWADLTLIADATGSVDVRLAAEEEFDAVFTDCELGAMPPLGDLYGLPVYFDKSLEAVGTVFFQAGSHRLSISAQFTDLVRAVRPHIAHLSHDRIHAA